MKEEFMSMIGAGGWQTIASVLFFIIYLANFWVAVRRPKAVMQRSVELPLNE